MDPTTVIVSALVKSLASSLGPLAQRAMTDGYLLLKAKLVQRYGATVASAIAGLEADPKSAERQAAVERALRAAGTEHDDEIVALASQLWHLVEGQSPTPTMDPVEAVQRMAGAAALRQTLEDHVTRIWKVRQNHNVNDADLLTRNVRGGSNVPTDVANELVSLHADMRAIIGRIAERIEAGAYAEDEQALAVSPEISLSERERALRLIKADKEVHVSYQTLRMTVEFFKELNSQILMSIEEATGPELANRMLGNAIMISELADFVINYINSFAVGGDSEIDAMWSDSRDRLSALRQRQDALVRRVNELNVEPAVREQTLREVAERSQSIDLIEEEWNKYRGEVKDLKSRVDEVRGRIPTLEVIRENAEVQISVLQHISLLLFLKHNTEEIGRAVDTLQGLRLAPLNSNRVRRLLGMGAGSP